MNKAPIENTVPKLHQQISNNLDTGNLLNIEALESYFNDVHNDFVNWFLVETTDESLKFMYFDKEHINGIQVARTVNINKEFSWQVQVHGTKIISEVLTNIPGGPPTKLLNKYDLNILLNTIGQQLKLCSGCDNQDFNCLSLPCSDKKGNITGKLESIAKSESETIKIRRSINCQFLIVNNYKQTRCQSCAKLNKVLCNSLYKYNNGIKQSGKDSDAVKNSSSTSNWRFLSANHQKQRYVDQQRRRINAEKREQYLKRKCEEEKNMLQLTQRDSNDFEIMFKQLDDIEETPQFSSNCNTDETLDDDASRLAKSVGIQGWLID